MPIQFRFGVEEKEGINRGQLGDIECPPLHNAMDRKELEWNIFYICEVGGVSFAFSACNLLQLCNCGICLGGLHLANVRSDAVADAKSSGCLWGM